MLGLKGATIAANPYFIDHLSDLMALPGHGWCVSFWVLLYSLLCGEGLRIVFPGEGEAFYTVLRAVRYALVGLWVALGAPWIFVQLKLAAADASGEPSR
jgi:hypothetical protein